jgi:hypothetical protein
VHFSYLTACADRRSLNRSYIEIEETERKRRNILVTKGEYG